MRLFGPRIELEFLVGHGLNVEIRLPIGGIFDNGEIDTPNDDLVVINVHDIALRMLTALRFVDVSVVAVIFIRIHKGVFGGIVISNALQGWDVNGFVSVLG